MSNAFMRVDDVAAELGISKSYAYKIVQRLNAELKNMGFLTVAGRINKKYFMERVYYGEHQKAERKDKDGCL
jgi:predicted transcriptional regulator